jgi:hypothetical protein
MKQRAWLLLIGVMMVLGVPDAARANPQSEARLIIVNQCTDPVWAVLTPGGSPKEGAALYNSGGWFQQYVTKSGHIQPDRLPAFVSWDDTGFAGSIKQGSKSLTLTSTPNPSNFAVGQIIGIAGAGNSGPLITTISAISSNILTLKDPAGTTIHESSPAEIYLPQQMATPIAAGKSLPLRIPNAGAPSVHFSFDLNCTGSPFAGGTCKMGSVPGTQTNGIDTLFEATFGCATNPDSSAHQSGCAFNPGDPAAQCQEFPDPENCPSLGFDDSYDVSAVDGYTLPMTIEVTPPAGTTTGGTCSGPHAVTTIDASGLDLASCPSESAATLFSTDNKQQKLIENGISLLTQPPGQGSACVAPYRWFEPPGTLGNPAAGSNTTLPGCKNGTCSSVSYYAAAGCDLNNPDVACPSSSGGQAEVGPKQNGQYAIQNTHYVQRLHQMATAYGWQFDDAFALQSCPSSNATPAMQQATSYATYEVTLCPNGNTTPYDTTQRWEFSGGICHVSASGSYQSLVACRQANLKYSCTNVTDAVNYTYADENKRPVTAALWAPVSKGGIAYSKIPTPVVECGPPNPAIENGTVTVPHCNLVYPAVGKYNVPGTYESPCPSKKSK